MTNAADFPVYKLSHAATVHSPARSWVVPQVGQTYWALIAWVGSSPEILGSAYSLQVDAEGFVPSYGALWSARELAEAHQSRLGDGTAGKLLPVGQVIWLGGCYFAYPATARS